MAEIEHGRSLARGSVKTLAYRAATARGAFFLQAAGRRLADSIQRAEVPGAQLKRDWAAPLRPPGFGTELLHLRSVCGRSPGLSCLLSLRNMPQVRQRGKQYRPR